MNSHKLNADCYDDQHSAMRECVIIEHDIIMFVDPL